MTENLRPTTAPRALEALDTGRHQVRQAAGRHCPAQVIASVGCDDFYFEHLNDGVWRFVSHSTYGNGSFVYGPGCDASGWPVPAETAARLSEIVEARS